MAEILAVVGVVLLLVIFFLETLLLRRQGGIDLSPLLQRFEISEKGQERLERALREEASKNREESSKETSRFREELGNSLKGLNDSVIKTMTEMGKIQQDQFRNFSEGLQRLTKSNEERLELVRETVERKLREIQEDNSRKLDEMRKTVDEKLQGTLEKRLSESFKLVSERLEKVHQGLGEMQELAGDVGDLKKVFANVKTRGIWGEFQLGNLIEQVLTPDQYMTNVAIREGSNERVEFAIKLPGKEDRDSNEVLLPIDAKFPKEDYERLVEASERGDTHGMEEALKALIVRLRSCAQDIRDKYIHPPRTTDFAIMFLPSEGMYAEVVKRPGLVDELQRQYRVSVAGPTTFTALLNSLQMGFRTLAIQKHSSEVWQVLSAVKTEFEKFGMVLEKVKNKLSQASKTIESAERRTRVMKRTLRSVEEMPSYQAQAVLGFDGEDEEQEEDLSVED